MKFEEDYPSLKEDVLCIKISKDTIIINGHKVKTEKTITEDDMWIHQGDIQKHCLDKQKVRDAIDMVLVAMTLVYGDGNVAVDEFVNALLKELGLQYMISQKGE